MRISDWSSDVCSSDLVFLKRGDPEGLITLFERHLERQETTEIWQALVYHMLQIHPEDPRRLAEFIRVLFADRKSVVSGKSVSVRVDLGGRRIIKTKTSVER